MGFCLRPSNYAFLKKLRESKTASLKPCKYLKEDTKLRYYQVIGCLHLLCLGRMILGDGPGLGKTIQAIAAYAFSLQKDPSLKILIVCPKSAMNQWREEFDKFTTGISVHVLSNTYAKRKDTGEYGSVEYFKKNNIPCVKLDGFEARKAQYDTIHEQVLIVGYYAIQEDYEFLITNRAPKFMFIMDEIQAIKNDDTVTWFGANKVSSEASRVYGLSATIIKNRLEEAYNIYKVVVPGLFGGRTKFLQSFTKRKKMVLWQKGKKRYFNKIVGYTNLKEFRETIDPYFLIRRTREVADELPKLISKKIMIEMSDDQEMLYKEAQSGDMYRRLLKARYFKMKEYLEQNKVPSEKDFEKFEILQKKYDESLTQDGLHKSKIAALSLCQMVANGPGWLKEEGISAKEGEFERLYEQELSAEKVIVFTRFKSGIHRLEKILDSLEYKHVKITGDDSGAERDIARKSFQDKEGDVNTIFITFAGSAAINLQSANVILFYDTPWSYGDLYQTIGRAQRIGSVFEHILLIHMICRKTIDEHVIVILESKKQLITEVMGDIAEGAIDFKDEVLFKDSENDVDALYGSVFGKVLS